MSYVKIPVIFHPLKILFVDDDEQLLKYLDGEFCKQYQLETFMSPQNVIAKLSQISYSNYNIFAIDNSEFINDNVSKIRLDLGKILRIIDDKNKINIPGVLVSDHEMPGINGIQVCQQLQNLPIRKILLTGKLDLSDAIQALSAGTIDCYVRKELETFVNDLFHYIKQEHVKFFNNVLGITNEMVMNSQLSFLIAEDYQAIFFNVINTYNIIEYYLIDFNGSFLLVDATGDKFIFNIQTENSLDEFIDMFISEPQIRPFVNAIKAREIIPYTHAIHPHNYQNLPWHKLFHAAHKHGKYYWNILELHDESLIGKIIANEQKH